MITTSFIKLTKHKSFNYLVFLFNLLFATAVCWGVSSSLPRGHDVLLMWLVINCISLRPIVFKLFIIPLFALILFSPIGYQYGYPNAGMIASLMQTNSSEAYEFIDFKTITLYFLVITGFILTILLTKQVTVTKKQSYFFKLFSIMLAALFIISITKEGVSYSRIINIFPFSINQYNHYIQSSKKSQELSVKKDDWQIISKNFQYKNYVLIIGESASRNYLSAYGYPIKNSLFLEKANGIQYNNYIAPAAYTALSVPRFLTIPNTEFIEYQNSLISLANKSGMETYWLSNQGKIGDHDTEVTYVSLKSKHRFYLSDTISVSGKYLDNEMLPEFKHILETKTESPKLVVIHLMGSHRDFCERLDPKLKHFNYSNNDLSCYLSSLWQTDKLLKDIYQLLEKQKQPFSMIYLSDHGLTPIRLKHGLCKDSLKSPLFKISSDSLYKITNDDIISGLGLIWFFTEWLGIDTQNQHKNNFLSTYKVNSFNDVQVYDNKLIYYTDLEDFNNKTLKPNQ